MQPAIPAFAFLASVTVLLFLFAPAAQAIDLCGNGTCGGFPPETCATCPQDCGPCPPPPGPSMQVTVINMIPFAQSAEVGQDSEPNLSVNPNNPQQIAGSAFTANPTGAMGTAPIYVSTNGGATWAMNNIVPSGNGMTGDITVRFADTSNVLYAGTLRGGAGLTLNILRTFNFTGAGAMALLVNRAQEDQPYVEASTFGGADRVYVGNNDLSQANGRTATIDRSLNGAVATPAFNSLRIETRNTCGQDGPPIRTTIHPDGTVYAVFYRYRPAGACNSPIPSDLVVVRDDNG